MGFPRQEYWSELLFPSPGDLPNPGIKPVSPALAGRFFFFFFLPLNHQESSMEEMREWLNFGIKQERTILDIIKNIFALFLYTVKVY